LLPIGSHANIRYFCGMWDWQRTIQFISFLLTSAILVGLLIGVGWLYKFGKIDTTDAILIYILGQFVDQFRRLVSKYNKVDMPEK
jgi:hypothetical protein